MLFAETISPACRKEGHAEACNDTKILNRELH